MEELEIEGKMVFPKDFFQKDFFKVATPVAKKVAVHRMKNGEKFSDIEDDLWNIIGVEGRLHESMKKSLIEHVKRHGLDIQALKLFEEFQAVKFFDRNKYNQVLRKVRKAYVKDRDNRNLEYLIAKINEYLQKVADLSKTAYNMVVAGITPDFDIWSDKVVMQDNLFEENKQFLKQALHHLRTLQQNRVKLGISDLRMLLYHKEGCRREKLYHSVENMIITIFNELDEKERREIYPEICNFVAEIVPKVGFISAHMVLFITSYGYISDETRQLLIKIKSIIMRMGMKTLITYPLVDYYNAAKAKVVSNQMLSKTDTNVLEIIDAYGGVDNVKCSAKK